MKILITAPSLNENENVSGISTIVRQIMKYGHFQYSHFSAGRKDRDQAGPAWLARQALLPFQFYRRVKREKPGAAHINTALTDLSIMRDAALAWAAKRAGAPLVLAVHGGRYLLEDIGKRWLARITEKMLRRADVVVVYSEFERQNLESRWSGLPLEILPNAIPFSEAPQVARNNKIPQLVFFGRMHESKGLHDLIVACQSLRDAGLDFQLKAYGEGPIRDMFVREMSAAIGEKFHYGGVIAGAEKWEKLAQGDIFVLPSRYGEGLPMAMLEAMAVGCVVVVGDVSSVASVIDEGVNGFMIEPRNTGQLSDKLRRLLTNKDLWPPVRQAAVATVKEKFCIENYMSALENIYRKAAAK
jgi:glycosyltransferase involved in cell wall biosynthesis